MKKIRLKLENLAVESFTTDRNGGVRALSTSFPSAGGNCSNGAGGCGTYSLNATYCDCSGGPNCTVECVLESQATSIDICCG